VEQRSRESDKQRTSETVKKIYWMRVRDREIEKEGPSVYERLGF